MSRKMISTIALAATLVGVGCFRAPDAPGVDGDWSSPTGDYGYSEGTLTVSAAAQEGDMGEIRGFSGAARDMTGSYSSGYSNIRLDSVGSDWWVMSSINISGDLAGPEFAPGTRRTYTSGVWTDGEPTVSVTGCSGPEFGNYTFDSSDADVEISVQSMPGGMRQMNYSVRFRDGLTTRGSFQYRIEANTGSVRSGI